MLFLGFAFGMRPFEGKSFNLDLKIDLICRGKIPLPLLCFIQYLKSILFL